MFLEVVHANGLYDVVSDQHTDPMPSERMHNIALAAAELMRRGDTVLYRPNYGSEACRIAESPRQLALAAASDPFLRRLDEDVRADVVVCPDGAGIGLEGVIATVCEEDKLLVNAEQATFVGLYTSACVLSEAMNVKSRHPDLQVGIAPEACIDSVSYGRGWRPNKTVFWTTLRELIAPTPPTVDWQVVYDF